MLLFVAMIVFSAFSVRWVQVENEITNYLPEDAEAKRGLTIMNEEFITYATADVMLKGVTVEQAQAAADMLSGMDHVALVQFSEDDSHYRDGKALLSLTFDDVTSSEVTEQAMEKVREALADYDTTIHTDIAFSIASILAEQMSVVLIFVVLVVLAVLVFTSSTYAEIPVMLLTFIVAAIINLGTAFLMGPISFVSNSVAVVLQLALSVDYAIIFVNRYKEEHQSYDIIPAVERALAASIPEISASSLTTIAGLASMTLMEFRLGADMGFNLMKAIALSLLTVFLFMPGLLVFFGKAMDKTKHRNFVPKISFVGRFAYATRHVVPLLLVVLVVGAYFVNRRNNYAYSMYVMPAPRMTEYEATEKEIRDVFGESNIMAVLVPAGNYETEQKLLREYALRPEVKSATGLTTIDVGNGYSIGDKVNAGEFAKIAGVDEKVADALFAYYAADKGDHRAAEQDLGGYRASLIDLFLFLHDTLENGGIQLELSPEQQALMEQYGGGGLDTGMELSEEQTAMIDGLYKQLSLVRDQLESEHYSRLVLNLNLPYQDERTFAFLDTVHDMAERYYPEGVVLTGESVAALAFKNSFSSDNLMVGLMSLLMVMVILFFTFKSFGMPLLLILVIQGSIWMNFGIATLRGNYIYFLCYLIVGAIQMGANIDYAIVVSSRYREFRETMEPKEAVITTLNLAFPTVITSGLMMVCAGLLIGFRVSQCIIAGMGYYVGTGTSISLVLILFTLPQVLLLGDGFVAATTLRSENSRVLRFWKRNRLRLTGMLLAAASVFALLAGPIGRSEAGKLSANAETQVGALLKNVSSLRSLAEKLESEGADMDELKFNFAEQLMTDTIGTGILAEGEAQYETGLQTYTDGKAEYDAGKEKLAEAEAMYQAGLVQYENGMREYAAGKEKLAAGQAEYDAGLARYEAGKQQYAEGQALYNEKLAVYEQGLADYEAGKQKLAEGQALYDDKLAQYNEAKAAVDSLAPLFEMIAGLEGQVSELQGRYSEAVANGDNDEAARILPVLQAAEAALNAQIAGVGVGDIGALYSEALGQLAAAEQQLAEGKAELDAGYAQLAEAEAQLAEGEKLLAEGKAELEAAEQQLRDAEVQLAAGKAELDAGYKELAAAEEQLAAGEAQLADGAAQIFAGRKKLEEAEGQLTDGRKQLDDAEQQLADGRRQLEENLVSLNDSLDSLDAYNDETERLREGLNLLTKDEGVRSRLKRSAGAIEVLNIAENYYRNLLGTAQNQQRASVLSAALLAAAACLALVSLPLSLRKKSGKLAAVLAGAAAFAAFAGLMLWRVRCGMLSPLPFAAGVVLCVFAILFSELLLRRSRENTPAPAPEA